MKSRIFSFAFAFSLSFAMASICPAQAPAAGSREQMSLNADWVFHKGTLDPAVAVAVADTGTIAWEKISIPHTWNALDGQDGGNNYFMGDGWYRRTVVVTPEMAGKTLYVRFEGVDRTADVYVNGKLIGTHIGGNQAFVFDATAALHSGDNLLAVRASNANDGNNSSPIFRDATRTGPDYTFFGGIYRPAELIAASPLHIVLTDFASPGVFITTPLVTDALARVHVRAMIESTGKSDPALVDFTIRDAAGKVVAQATLPAPTPAMGAKEEIDSDLAIDIPHRWNGVADPYLYTVEVALKPANTNRPLPAFDAVTQNFGVRTVAMDKDEHFLLNGKIYPLHGVCRHQDRENEGWALSEQDHIDDIAMIREMGANAIRLAHYQQSDFLYSLCDKAGLVIWAEVPNINYIGPGQAYTDNARQQLTELIRQNYNHASIAFWGVGNEVRKPRETDPWATPGDVEPAVWFKQMSDLVHKEDPTRMSGVVCRRDTPQRDSTDVYGLNIYYGWYEKTNADVDPYFSTVAKQLADAHKPPGWGLTEYGAGGSIYFHSETPRLWDHTEEYQCLFHEANWAAIKNHPEIWGSFIWNMFDFAVDDRFEGDQQGINNKGMVTHDHKTRKDVFYFYKANWNPEPMVHINSKRFATRGLEKIAVKAYSNAPKVTLSVNGTPLGEKENNGLAVFVWDAVPLKQGANKVIATATFPDGKTIIDTADWTYTPGAPTEIYQAQDDAMRQVYKNGPPRGGRGNYSNPRNPNAPPTIRRGPAGPPVAPTPDPVNPQ